MLGKIRKKLKGKKGFTLVELIVVIVIILVLAAALVPQLLKYVDQANRANCQSEAATLLAQTQADYTASQASAQTGITVDWEGTGITVQQVTVIKVSGSLSPEENQAHFTVKAAIVSGGTGAAYDEISSFAYNNGKFTATWNAEASGSGDDAVAAGWKVTKNASTE